MAKLVEHGNKEYTSGNTPQKRDQLRLFVASPSDVQKYRDVTKKILDELNEISITRGGEKPLIHPFFWEISTTPNYTNDFQEKIFNEFGPWCDIFILILWTKIGGGGTEKEYEKFISSYKENNPDVVLLVAHIHEKVEPATIDTEQLSKLRSFVEKHESNWALLGIARGTIKSVTKYESLLRKELTEYVRKNIDRK